MLKDYLHSVFILDSVVFYINANDMDFVLLTIQLRTVHGEWLAVLRFALLSLSVMYSCPSLCACDRNRILCYSSTVIHSNISLTFTSNWFVFIFNFITLKGRWFTFGFSSLLFSAFAILLCASPFLYFLHNNFGSCLLWKGRGRGRVGYFLPSPHSPFHAVALIAWIITVERMGWTIHDFIVTDIFMISWISMGIFLLCNFLRLPHSVYVCVCVCECVWMRMGGLPKKKKSHPSVLKSRKLGECENREPATKRINQSVWMNYTTYLECFLSLTKNCHCPKWI